MNEKKYLIYLDILGFTSLGEEIASKMCISANIVRGTFINVIKERIGIIEDKGRIIGKTYSGDSCILVADTLDNVFVSILEILDHDTGYKGYEKQPLEIAIGVGEYDERARFDGTNLIIEKATIEFLKTNIGNYYRKWYKERNKQSVKSTFIVLTELAYNELEPLDKKICTGIEYEDNKKKKHNKFFTANVDKVQQRGRVFEFLEKIGHPGKRYGRIDDVYVPPLEYEAIAKTLKEKRFVFITGTQEYGKTYTAVRLMWEYYNNGYEPKWITGTEAAERVEVRKRLENISAELKPGCIIYFEDPFGKTRYEKREGLEREIGIIIDSVKQVEDVYIIVTSKEEVFKEFEKEKLSAKDLGEFEKRLSIKKTPSYNYEKRKEMLLKWAEEENCKWFRNEELQGLVLDSIKDEKILPTPLSINGFAMATVFIEKEDKLKEKIKEKSKDAEKAIKVVKRQISLGERDLRSLVAGDWETVEKVFKSFGINYSEQPGFRPKIFLSYARPDMESVSHLYDRLIGDGFEPWMDIKSLLAGEKWEHAIRKAIRQSDFSIVCLSRNAVYRRGFLQKEIRMALDILDEMPDDDIYVIPVRLEKCEVPISLSKIQRINLFEADGYERLISNICVAVKRRDLINQGRSKE